MPLTATYLFISSMDIDPDKEDLFNEVYDTEHIPNILKVPGVISIRRFALEPVDAGDSTQDRNYNPDDEPRYSAIYEIEDPQIMVSDAWAEAAELGRWPTEVRPFTKNRRHVLRRVIG
jgi:hypothetical protein